MSISTYTEGSCTETHLPTTPSREPDQKHRIMAALGSESQLPSVNEESLSRYYQYLSANLPFPFFAHFPEPTNAREEKEFRCVVVELLDPAQHVGDEFDGIFCKTCKGKYEVNLPLIDLYLPEDDRISELIEDYWYWFWNWR
jgi:hypothetical protein